LEIAYIIEIYGIAVGERNAMLKERLAGWNGRIFGMYVVREKSFYRQVLRIMLPVAMQQAINMGVNMMDTLMLGSFGEAQLSASSLANSFYSLFTILCMGIIGGCSVLAAQYWGAGNKEKVRETFNLAIRLALALSAVFALVTALFPYQIMAMYTPETDVIEYGVRYLRITVAVYLVHGVSQVVAFLMRSVRQPKLGLVVSIISFFVNIFFNWVFIFGKLGAPRMEIAGAALGTLIARAVEFAVTFVYVLAMDKDLALRPRHLLRGPTKELYYNYFRLGAAALASDGLLGLGNVAISMVLGRMGAAVVAANAICQVVDRLFTMVVSGISNASSIITGNTVGRGDKELAISQGQTFYLLSVLFGAVSGVLVFLFGGLTIGAYNLDPGTVVLAREIMLAYSFIAFFQSVQSVMTKGVLRGGGDTKFLLVADVLFMWVVSIPLGILTGLVLPLPAWVAVLSLRIDWMIKSIWCVRRLNSGKWIRETKKLPNLK